MKNTQNFLFKEQKTKMVFLLSLSLLFMFSFVTADVDTSPVNDVFQVNKVISYNKPCMNNGTWCSASATCNYTFYDKDNSIQQNNILATNVGSGGSSIWQHNFSQTQTGLYKVDMACIDSGLQGSETLYYEVTGSGDNESVAFLVIILFLSLGVIIWGINISDAPLTIFGSLGLYFVSLNILFNGIAGTKDPVTTWGIGVILLGVAMYVSIRSAYELITN